MRPLLAAQTDDRLVALARAGSEHAFEAIVDRYRAPLVRYAGRFLPASRAEDAVQQAFMNAYEALGRSDAAIELKPWLYRITHNASLNLLRQNGWDYDQIPADFDGVLRPDQAVELAERLRATIAAVKRLPDRQRDAIVLRELEGRSYEEIAAALGTGGGAVRQLLNRARAGLRTAATAFTPWPLVARTAASPSGANVERAVEVAGAAGIVKVGAAALATAAVVGGTVAGPIRLTSDGDKPPRASEALAAPAKEAEKADERSGTEVAERGTAQQKGNRAHSRNRRRGSGGSGRRATGDDDRREDRSGRGGGVVEETEDERELERDDDDDSPNSGSGGDADDHAVTVTEDNSGSGSGDDPVAPEEHHSSSGSDDGAIVPTTTTTESGETLRTDSSGPGSGELDD